MVLHITDLHNCRLVFCLKIKTHFTSLHTILHVRSVTIIFINGTFTAWLFTMWLCPSVWEWKKMFLWSHVIGIMWKEKTEKKVLTTNKLLKALKGSSQWVLRVLSEHCRVYSAFKARKQIKSHVSRKCLPTQLGLILLQYIEIIVARCQPQICLSKVQRGVYITFKQGVTYEI